MKVSQISFSKTEQPVDGDLVTFTVPEEDSEDSINIGSHYNTRPVRREGEPDATVRRECRY